MRGNAEQQQILPRAMEISLQPQAHVFHAWELKHWQGLFFN